MTNTVYLRIKAYWLQVANISSIFLKEKILPRSVSELIIKWVMWEYSKLCIYFCKLAIWLCRSRLITSVGCI